jgi:hypothetical protein
VANGLNDREVDEYFAAIRARLERGAEDYGDKSYELDDDRILDEIEQELLDLAGWAFLRFARLRRLRKGEPHA